MWIQPTAQIHDGLLTMSNADLIQSAATGGALQQLHSSAIAVGIVHSERNSLIVFLRGLPRYFDTALRSRPMSEKSMRSFGDGGLLRFGARLENGLWP